MKSYKELKIEYEERQKREKELIAAEPSRGKRFLLRLKLLLLFPIR